MIKLYGFSSPNVMKVLIMFEETGLQHEVRTVEVYSKEQYSVEFGRLTPNRKVPVIGKLKYRSRFKSGPP